LLAGAPIPASLLQQMDAVSGLDAAPALPDVPAGLPSDLLERRPDIRAAEHTLLSANADIGAARAAFFPSVSLTASGGAASAGLNHLFSPGQQTWLLEPSITLPIFTGGENLANLDIAKTKKRIEIANYEKAIQSAFHDASDALNARSTYVAQLQAQQDLVTADSRYYQLSQMLLTAGSGNYLNVLIAENSLLTARLDLVSLKLAAQQNNITLYKALGGGWQEHSGPTVSATPF
jgi:multidrug efflux system outer membrane protein